MKPEPTGSLACRRRKAELSATSEDLVEAPCECEVEGRLLVQKSKCAACVSELAARIGLAERYVRQWALAQASNGDINRASYAHDLPKETGRGDIAVLQRARPVPHLRIALGEALDTEEPLKSRALVGAFAHRVARLWRVLVQFAAAGSPL
jgi:hypothetical protein